ncbi:BTB domain-containing protein [Mycena kentingensis (nom. inval.)]|nr:BTB domain-containing protein [Mycena kentingensis (nom. inval.)]
MSTDGRPAKRPRDNDTDGEAPIARSPDYWFDDGSIVLQVESTQFRVAKSMLARHSSVFADMLSLPPTQDPLIEGCPLVELAGDSSRDWTHLLGAIYTKGGITDRNDIPSFDQLAAILRLSKKYDIPELRRRCVDLLKDRFPTTLADYDKASEPSVSFGIATPIELLVRAVNLAREVGLFSILPSAFYAINDLGCADGIYHEYFGNLNAADQIIALIGREKMGDLFTDSPLQWAHPHDDRIPCDSCRRESRCQVELVALQKALLAHGHYLKSIVMPWSGDSDMLLCEECAAAAKSIHEGARVPCWDKIPSCFGLPSWEELLKLDLE